MLRTYRYSGRPFRSGRHRLLLAFTALLCACAPSVTPPSTSAPAPPTSAPAAPASAPSAVPAASIVPSPSPASAIPSPVASQAPAASGPLKHLVVGTLPTIGNAPFIIAQQKGSFAQEGLDVELQMFGAGNEVVAPLGAGQIDAANSVTPSAGLLNAIARGLQLKIVASNGSIEPNRNIANIVVRKGLEQPDGSYVDLASLARPLKAAAAADGLLPHAVLLLEAEKAGLTISDVSMTFLGLPDINAALSTNSVDVAASGEPLITIGQQQGLLARWKPMADLYPNAPWSNLLYGPALLADRDTGSRLMRAYLRGVRDYENAFSRNVDREAIVNTISGPLNVPPALWQTMQEQGGLAYINPDGVVDVAPLQPAADLWERTGVLQTGFDLSSLVDNSFASDAVNQIGKYQ